ncbi:transglutaminase family protein [Limobrevibacterium gyesilva]|uniref:Transglutaminase family protein n=1 Tax=Limobrevibacterium gyesilva TaxID=2991712 RepID=A0AA42CDR6_9PROT|nr:transglutaminase family protein [Limobrevibacterium gyesilva]MCW3474259.1 transglutaminase family protein [Limobrevibacterium gyesilva]
MSIHVALTHRTTYRYDKAVALGPQTIRLRPAPHSRTPVLSYSLSVAPKPHFLNWQQDPQGNFLARVVFSGKVTHFEVSVDVVADMATINPFDFFLEPEAETWPFAYDPVLEQELAPFRRLDPPGPLLTALLAEIPRGAQRTVDMLVALNRAVQSRVGYIVRLEPGVWTPEETLEAAKGSCRDSAWLLVQLLRSLGFAARFVSGYLIQLVADIKPLEGPEGPAADFTDLHAWAEVYLPGAGWIGLDATSGLMTGEGHIPLAASPDPQSAAPISGAVEECDVTFAFAMGVTRVLETPRVTRPYTERQWQDILAAGAKVDQALVAGDVRLTLGGEPTFVAASDFEAPEWNTDALGPTKRGFAGRLIRRLAKLWSPGAALQYGMGKLYPGEPLPRWTLSAHWRADGEAVWQDPGLLADPDRDRGTATAEDAAAFAAALAERLQVDPAMALPAHEDVHYYLWKEHRLPANVVAQDSKLRDPLERARMVRIFDQGLASPVGSVLPLRRVIDGGARRWQTDKWFFRSNTLFLIPGDSPIGLRLPLDSLPWADPDTVEPQFEADPFAVPAPLPPQAVLRRLREARPPESSIEGFRPVTQDIPVVGQDEPDLVRTALTVESRGGVIHVFFPPLFAAEDWLDLVAAVEATAREAGQPIVLEGYLPPGDPRLLHFSVTPDPGVIEVNVHPASTWAEHMARTEQLYEEARQVGLASEKFMMDGRHVGTGGGNHVVMGGATPADSPFLRRPDLLKSLLGFWHNHPSLSFLFSGLFIGPTSQHPRIDEARDDATAELEIAFSQITPSRPTPPWLTDRIFRNILADMTGNTHRTEFCIDKMYDPNGVAGRRGLVEFRAFEMPPHARMSAAQMLLMRAAVAAFWQHPYERRMVRWGTRLHDAYMLPHYCEQDFRDVLEELAGWGFRLDPDWFAPHLEFRFPKMGESAVRGMELEIRHALEPWHVLGEDASPSGMVRYVDSSAERLQARVTGWVEERYVLACNGVAVPLTRTGQAGEYVAGVRFKAWAPPNALHPTIAAQTPLVFDIYDRWSGRSLGGLSHHVAHPGGRSYDTFPVNAGEAEARRRARFFPIGHTPGPMPEPRGTIGREHPRTLDLRRFA